MSPAPSGNDDGTTPGEESQEVPLKRSSRGEKGILPTEIIRSEVNLLTLPFFALWNKDLKRKTRTEYKTVMRRGGPEARHLLDSDFEF